MAEEWEITRETSAPIGRVMNHFMHPEDLPKFHPHTVKSVTVKSSVNNAVIFDEEFVLLGMNLAAVNKVTLYEAENTVVLDTIDGDGKGSRVSMVSARDENGHTVIRYIAKMEMGPFAFLAKGPVKSAMEKAADEDVACLDAEIQR